MSSSKLLHPRKLGIERRITDLADCSCRGRFIVNIRRVRQVVKLFGQSVDEHYGFVTQLFHEARLIYHAQCNATSY
jgi:hypothetical protein